MVERCTGTVLWGKGRKVGRREGSVPLREAHTHAGLRGPTSPSCSELMLLPHEALASMHLGGRALAREKGWAESYLQLEEVVGVCGGHGAVLGPELVLRVLGQWLHPQLL